MFSKLDKYFVDESKVKFVFDHFRNIGIIGFISAAALWKRVHPRDGWVEYFDVTISLVLWLIAMYLMMLNINILIIKFKVKELPRHLKYIFLITYALIFGAIIGFFVQDISIENQPDLSIEKSVSKTSK